MTAPGTTPTTRSIPSPQAKGAPVGDPTSTEAIDELDQPDEFDEVDEVGRGSFPASDPPSWWAGQDSENPA